MNRRQEHAAEDSSGLVATTAAPPHFRNGNRDFCTPTGVPTVGREATGGAEDQGRLQELPLCIARPTYQLRQAKERHRARQDDHHTEQLFEAWRARRHHEC